MANNLMKNRRANIPVIILVLGVLVVCALALLSFYVANFKVESDFSGITFVEQLNSKIESNIYNGIPIDSIPALEKKVRTGLLWTKTKVIFSVEYHPLT